MSAQSVKKNVALLALCQALSMTSITVLFTVAALIGKNLASDPAMATLPIALLQVSVMLTTIPASLLMQHRGRRFGFALGTAIGIAGTGLGIWATLQQDFLLFSAAMILLGIFNGFAGFYRFAAAEVADEGFRARVGHLGQRLAGRCICRFIVADRRVAGHDSGLADGLAGAASGQR
jgi:MFS family permease